LCIATEENTGTRPRGTKKHKERMKVAKKTRGRRKTKARRQEAQQQQRRNGLCNKWEQKQKKERGTEREDEEGNQTNQCGTQEPLLQKSKSKQAGQQPRRAGGDEGETQGRRKEAKGEANTKHQLPKTPHQ
jgi:hypothetical protein